MFDPGTAPLYDSSNSNIKIAHNSFEHFLCNSSDFFSDVVFENLCCLWIVFRNSVFQVASQKIVRRVEIWEIGWSEVIGSTRNESVPWKVLPEVFKSSVRAMRWCSILLEHHSVHINVSLPSHCMNKLSSHHQYVPLCVDVNFLLTYWLLGMFMRLLRCPKPHVLLVDMPTQMNGLHH